MTVALLIFAMVAAADPQGVTTGTLMRDKAPVDVPEGRSVGDEARAVSDKFAACIVRRHYRQVVKALATDMAQQYESLPKLMDRECFFGRDGVQQSHGLSEVQLNIGPESFRGALYKALVERKFARHAAEFGPTPAVMPVENGQVLTFAGCVVRRDPAGSLQLLLATAGTKQEDAALAQLRPQLGQCLVQGATFGFSKAILVAYLAEAYYREAMASNPAGAD